jgi:hypothetical protein
VNGHGRETLKTGKTGKKSDTSPGCPEKSSQRKEKTWHQENHTSNRISTL